MIIDAILWGYFYFYRGTEKYAKDAESLTQKLFCLGIITATLEKSVIGSFC